MSCLKNVTRAIILTGLICGFVALGGKDFLMTQVKNYVNPSHDVVLERAQKVGDFSKINNEFEIEKAAGPPIDHSFLHYKKELPDYGFEVKKISLKNKTVKFHQL